MHSACKVHFHIYQSNSAHNSRESSVRDIQYTNYHNTSFHSSLPKKCFLAPELILAKSSEVSIIVSFSFYQ